MIKVLYENSTSEVLINNTQGKLFKTTIEARRGCLLSPILFNIFLEEILYNYSSSISIGGMSLWNLKFENDMLASTNDELLELTNLLVNSATRYGM